MAYVALLENYKWGGVPKITLSFYYDMQRSGSSMQYRIKVVVGRNSEKFGYKIGTAIYFDGSDSAAETATIKGNSPSTWSTAYTYESGWLTVLNKTSGTTALKLVITTNATRGNLTNNFELPVDSYIASLSLPASITAEESYNIAFVKQDPSYYAKVNFYISSESAHEEVELEPTDTSFVLQFHQADIYPLFEGLSWKDLSISMAVYDGNDSILDVVTYERRIYFGSYSPNATFEITKIDNSAIPAAENWDVVIKDCSLVTFRVSWTDEDTFGAPMQVVTITGLSTSESGYRFVRDDPEFHDYYVEFQIPVPFSIVEENQPSVLVQDARTNYAYLENVPPVVVHDNTDPLVSESLAYRSNSSGIEQEDGTYLTVFVDAAPADYCGGLNDIIITYAVSEDGETFSDPIEVTSGQEHVDTGEYELMAQYYILFTISDTLGNTVNLLAVISIAQATLQLRDGGLGAAFGKYCDRDEVVQSVWDLELDKELLFSDPEIYAPLAYYDENQVVSQVKFRMARYVVTFRSGIATVSCPGATADSLIFALRKPGSLSSALPYGIGGAACYEDDVVTLALDSSNTTTHNNVPVAVMWTIMPEIV